MSLPVAVVKSNASVRLLKPAPAASIWASPVLYGSRIDRDNRSSRQTTRVSPGRKSLIAISSTGRSFLAPLVAGSSWMLKQPAALRASICKIKDWSAVETRAYPINSPLGGASGAIWRLFFISSLIRLLTISSLKRRIEISTDGGRHDPHPRRLVAGIP